MPCPGSLRESRSMALAHVWKSKRERHSTYAPTLPGSVMERDSMEGAKSSPGSFREREREMEWAHGWGPGTNQDASKREGKQQWYQPWPLTFKETGNMVVTPAQAKKCWREREYNGGPRLRNRSIREGVQWLLWSPWRIYSSSFQKLYQEVPLWWNNCFPSSMQYHHLYKILHCISNHQSHRAACTKRNNDQSCYSSCIWMSEHLSLGATCTWRSNCLKLCPACSWRNAQWSHSHKLHQFE